MGSCLCPSTHPPWQAQGLSSSTGISIPFIAQSQTLAASMLDSQDKTASVVCVHEKTSNKALDCWCPPKEGLLGIITCLAGFVASRILVSRGARASPSCPDCTTALATLMASSAHPQAV